MLRTEKALYVIFFVGLTIATNVMITNYLVKQSMDNMKLPHIPKIVAVDLDKIVQDKINDGMSALEVVTFTDTLTSVLLADGYIVLDAKSILNAPSQHVLKNVSTSQLAIMVKERGIKIRDNKTFEEVLKNSQKQLDEMLKPE
jgi:hypothetical protein